MRYRLVIFDLDGTILDTVRQLAVSLNEALKRSGFDPVEEDLIRSRIGNGSLNLVLRSIEGLEGADPDIIRKDYRNYYNEHCTENTEEYEGMSELMARLKDNGIKIAVVTNKSEPAAVRLCDTKFPGLIDVVKGHRDGIAHKPDPCLVNEVLAELDEVRDDAVFVGDSEVDVQTARNAGLPCISVLWGFRDHALLLENGAQIFAHTPAEMMKMF